MTLRVVQVRALVQLSPRARRRAERERRQLEALVSPAMIERLDQLERDVDRMVLGL